MSVGLQLRKFLTVKLNLIGKKKMNNKKNGYLWQIIAQDQDQDQDRDQNQTTKKYDCPHCLDPLCDWLQCEIESWKILNK